MVRGSVSRLLVLLAGMAPMAIHAQARSDAAHAVVGNARGLRMMVDGDNTQPTLRIVLPHHALNDDIILVVFPEHVTVRKHGGDDVEHIYLWRDGNQGQAPPWRRTGRSLEYERKFDDGVQLTARATLQADGVLFEYRFHNTSATKFDLIWAPTDPRLTGMLHDARLERTYVHHQNGWGLLAENTPGRLSMPLKEWLPNRYHDSFTWPVPAKLVERGADGITSYDNPVPVDEPVIATLSVDRKWVVASFSHTTGNVWSNPALTCQHVDETSTLAAGGRVQLEVKLLIFQGSLDEVLNKVVTERNTLH